MEEINNQIESLQVTSVKRGVNLTKLTDHLKKIGTVTKVYRDGVHQRLVELESGNQNMGISLVDKENHDKRESPSFAANAGWSALASKGGGPPLLLLRLEGLENQ